MSTAKRLVLSLRGRNNSQGTVATATSSTRLVSAGTSPGHELDEIAVVSGTGSTSHHFTYGGCVGNNNDDDAGSAAAAVARYSTAHSLQLEEITELWADYVMKISEMATVSTVTFHL
ncbi:hypothetical protein ACLKA7_000376 [Drosophila subpalustris]